MNIEYSATIDLPKIKDHPMNNEDVGYTFPRDGNKTNNDCHVIDKHNVIYCQKLLIQKSPKYLNRVVAYGPDNRTRYGYGRFTLPEDNLLRRGYGRYVGGWWLV